MENFNMNDFYESLRTEKNIQAAGGEKNFDRIVNEYKKSQKKAGRHRIYDSIFTLFLDAVLLYGIVILLMNIFS